MSLAYLVADHFQTTVLSALQAFMNKTKDAFPATKTV